MDTLVLDGHYRPLRRVSWKQAISWWFQGRVEILEEYQDRHIRTIDVTYPMPAVVRFVGRVVKRWFSRGLRFSRKNVWIRDEGKCAYCGDRMSEHAMTYDHVVPRSQGGRTEWSNIVACCVSCNKAKRDRTPVQAGMALRVRPHEPRHLPGSGGDRLEWQDGMPESWRAWAA